MTMYSDPEHPVWFQKKKVDEVLFCEELLEELPMICIHDSFFTVDGRVKYRIPAGTQSGDTFRLRGKGVPTRSGRGDQFVTVRVRTPRNLTPAQIEALKKFDATLTPGNYGNGGSYAKAG